MRSTESRTALVVEPDLLELRRYRRLLLGAGFERVLPAGSGAEALTVMAAELVHLVLTPWETGELSGLELLRALRRRGRNRNVPVVILDHGLSQQTIVAAVKAGVAGRLKLPADAAKLNDLLAAIAADAPPRTGADRGTEAPAGKPEGSP